MLSTYMDHWTTWNKNKILLGKDKWKEETYLIHRYTYSKTWITSSTANLLFRCITILKHKTEISNESNAASVLQDEVQLLLKLMKPISPCIHYKLIVAPLMVLSVTDSFYNSFHLYLLKLVRFKIQHFKRQFAFS